MPARSTDYTADGLTYRTCSRCQRLLVLDDGNFYRPPNREFESWCRDCGRTRNREARAARRSNHSVGFSRKFGVEIEFIGTYHALIREMRSRGLDVDYEGYTHRIRQGSWKIVTDGSVQGGYELVSPPLKGAVGRRAVEKACEALRAAGCRIDRQCGLHVHHEVRDLDLGAFQRLYRNWSGSQGATDGLVAASRRSNRWAQPLQPADLRRVDAIRALDDPYELTYIDRYRSLNVTCFPRYGTAEIRQHQGTLNAKKILAWIEFGQAFIAYATSNDEVLETSDTGALLEHLPLAPETKRYLRRRAEHFGYAIRNTELTEAF